MFQQPAVLAGDPDCGHDVRIPCWRNIRVAEPTAYFVINGGSDTLETRALALIETYRQVPAVVDLLSKAAAYELDTTAAITS